MVNLETHSRRYWILSPYSVVPVAIVSLIKIAGITVFVLNFFIVSITMCPIFIEYNNYVVSFYQFKTILCMEEKINSKNF